MRKIYKKLFFYAGVLVLVFALLSPNIFGTTLKFGTDSSGDSYFGFTDDMITNSNGKAWAVSSANLQSAIEDIPEGGIVYVPTCEITVSNLYVNGSITVTGVGSGYYPSSLTINHFNNTVLNVSGGIILNDGARLHNLRVNVSSTFSGNAVEINGSADGYYWNVPRILDNVYITCDSQSGVGLLVDCYASSDDRSVATCSFGDVMVKGFHQAVNISCYESGGNEGYFNQNTFENLFITSSYRGLNFNCEVGGVEISQNVFKTLIITNVDQEIILHGGLRNQFPNLMVMDSPSAYDIYFDANPHAGFNYFNGYFNSIYYNGTSNNTFYNRKGNSLDVQHLNSEYVAPLKNSTTHSVYLHHYSTTGKITCFGSTTGNPILEVRGLHTDTVNKYNLRLRWGDGSNDYGIINSTSGGVKVQELILDNVAPSSPVVGSVYLVTANSSLAVYNGSAWNYYEFD